MGLAVFVFLEKALVFSRDWGFGRGVNERFGLVWGGEDVLGVFYLVKKER